MDRLNYNLEKTQYLIDVFFIYINIVWTVGVFSTWDYVRKINHLETIKKRFSFGPVTAQNLPYRNCSAHHEIYLKYKIVGKVRYNIFFMLSSD